MPEGLEVYALCFVLQREGYNADCYGKHLLLDNQDWSFGLNGKMSIDGNGKLKKVVHAYKISKFGYKSTVPGDIKPVNNLQDLISKNKLGVNLIDATPEQLESIIIKWTKSRKTLGGLLLDQSHIAGIGVAWGSEILHRAELRPDIPAKLQDLTKLPGSIIIIRDMIKNIYKDYAMQQDTKTFVNGWFDNLYAIRSMKVYKKGNTVETGGRTWWIEC